MWSQRKVFAKFGEIREAVAIKPACRPRIPALKKGGYSNKWRGGQGGLFDASVLCERLVDRKVEENGDTKAEVEVTTTPLIVPEVACLVEQPSYVMLGSFFLYPSDYLAQLCHIFYLYSLSLLFCLEMFLWGCFAGQYLT